MMQENDKVFRTPARKPLASGVVESLNVAGLTRFFTHPFPGACSVALLIGCPSICVSKRTLAVNRRQGIAQLTGCRFVPCPKINTNNFTLYLHPALRGPIACGVCTRQMTITPRIETFTPLLFFVSPAHFEAPWHIYG
jgi:hypothetical protein